MKKVDSVISLISSLSKSEKRHFYSHVVKDNIEKDYLVIYDIIVSEQAETGREVKKVFYEQRPKGSFEVSIQYLYERLVETLLLLRRKKDIWYDLYTNICKARMLYERSLFHESLELLSETIELAQQYENNEVLTVALKLQQDYLISLSFPAVTQKDLAGLDSLCRIALRKSNEIAEYFSVYTLLRFYLFGKGTVSSVEREQKIEELWEKGLALYSSFQTTDLEIKRIHTFFQVYYLIYKREYEQAVVLLKDITDLLEKNRMLWGVPPVYYLSLLEEILGLIRSIGKWKEIPRFLTHLKRLEKNNSQEFQVNVRCVLFQYEIYPYLRKGDFRMCEKIMKSYRSILLNKEQWLTPLRRNELFLSSALIYLGLQDYKAAKKEIFKPVIDHTIDFLPMMRTIRLIRLLIAYETQELDLIKEESRIIRRGITLKKEEAFKVEHRVIWFMNKKDLPVLTKERESLWEKLSVEFRDIYKDKYEQQLLYIFDFTAWMESKILKKPLSDVLAEREANPIV